MTCREGLWIVRIEKKNFFLHPRKKSKKEQYGKVKIEDECEATWQPRIYVIGF